MTTDEPASGPTADTSEAIGDPVCWLHLVCDSCGALLEHADDPHRPGCDTATAQPTPLP